MFLGYNTNGLAHHDLFDAVELLAEIGYRGVAITIDHNALPPHGRHATSQQIDRSCGGCWNGWACGRSSRPAPGSCSIRGRSTSRRCFSDRSPGAADRLLQVRHRLRRRNWAAIACRSGRACSRASPPAMHASAALATCLTSSDGPAGRRACAKCSTTPRSRTCRSPSSPSRACSSTRCAAFEELLRADRRPEPAADARHRPPALPGRDADRRGDPPLGAAAGQRAYRGHARAASTST